jgi:hypothetical protein
MSSYTKGPWSRNIPPAKKYNTIFAGRNKHICHLDVVGLSDEEIEANCALIRAAPEMAEMLLAMFLRVSHGGPTRAEAETLLKKAGIL